MRPNLKLNYLKLNFELTRFKLFIYLFFNGKRKKEEIGFKKLHHGFPGSFTKTHPFSKQKKNSGLSFKKKKLHLNSTKLIIIIYFNF